MSSDYYLVKELKNNSLEAFKKVYYKYYKLVYFQAYQILNNKEDAEDVMQNTFLKFMNKINTIDDNSNIKQYLSLISKNEAIDLYRKKSNRKEIYDETILNNYKVNNENTDSFVIITLNNTLEKTDALILTYKIVYDYTFNEISKELSMPLGTILTRYGKAIKQLKKYYKENS